MNTLQLVRSAEDQSLGEDRRRSRSRIRGEPMLLMMDTRPKYPRSSSGGILWMEATYENPSPRPISTTVEEDNKEREFDIDG